MPPMKRTELQQVLTSVISSKNVYYQPPETVKMLYPCVVYNLAYVDIMNADDAPYTKHYKYQVTYITRDPDDPNIESITTIPGCKFDRYYSVDNLHHYSYEIIMY